jgi:transposase InsO family protein
MVAHAFMDNVYRYDGLPQVIISDRDKKFTSAFRQYLFKLEDTTLNMSPSYHPQTNDQIELLNQYLETYLRCAVNVQPKQWSKWLPRDEHWYNTTVHSALGKSPFQVLYGRNPRQLGV